MVVEPGQDRRARFVRAVVGHRRVCYRDLCEERPKGYPAAMDPNARSPDLEHASTGELVTRLAEQVSALVKGELELARAELTEKGKRAGAGAGLAGAGGLLAAFGLAILLAAAVAALALVWPVWLAALVVGIVVLVVAGGLALAGRSQLRRAGPPVPQHAARHVRDDVATVREAAKR